MTDSEEWVVWNGSIGILDMARIGDIRHDEGGRSASLAPPYGIVGPFSLDELENREKLLLRPNDDYGDLQTFVGSEHDTPSWERAIREAQRSPYVVQEIAQAARTVFPMMTYGHLEFKEMQVDVQPQAFLGKVAGCSSYLSASGMGSYSPASGIAPTFIINDAK